MTETPEAELRIKELEAEVTDLQTEVLDLEDKLDSAKTPDFWLALEACREHREFLDELVLAAVTSEHARQAYHLLRAMTDDQIRPLDAALRLAGKLSEG